MKEFLSRAGYRFTERNVEEDAAAYAELMALGVRTVPLTVVDGTTIKGFDQAALQAALTTADES